MKKTVNLILSIFVLGCVSLLWSSTEEKLYTCTGVSENYYISGLTRERENTIPFIYKTEKYLLGQTNIVSTNTWFFGKRDLFMNDVGKDLVTITDDNIGAWKTNGPLDYSVNFNRITKVIQIRESIKDTDRPGFLKPLSTFEGACVPTTRG
jgi:hypothetical protein